MPAAGVALSDVFGASIGPLLILVLVAGIFAWALIGTARYNSTVWEVQMREWRSLWVCKACGQTFRPQSERECATMGR
jgi:hypothetical protein